MLAMRIFAFLTIVFSCWNVSAGDAATPTPAIAYHRYDTPADPEGQMYHQFLPPVPKGSFYDTRQKASANINDTPENETIVSILEDGGMGSAFDGNWVRAYLLITTTEAGLPKKKELFKLFDVKDHNSDVPLKSIKVQPPPFIFSEYPRDAHKPHALPFRLIDLTGNGILDIWVEAGHAVVVISFQNGEFKDIFNSYSYTAHQNPECVDMDNDGSYEIKVPHRVYLDGFFRESHPIWMSFYEWDGTTYVLNNAKFYTQDHDISFQLLSAYTHHLRLQYNHQQALETEDPLRVHRSNPILIQKVDASRYFEVYDFFVGLVHYYRGELPRALDYLLRVITEVKSEDYRKAALSVLREMWNESADPRSFEIDYYRPRLVERYGDIPEVYTFMAGEKKLMSGGFRFPADEDEFLMFCEAKYVLWPNETVLAELEKVRQAKTEGIPFHLIDWN